MLRRPARALAGLGLVAWILFALAPPAAAHGAAGSTGASNYRSFFTDAGSDCLDWSVLAEDGFLRLRTRCPATVTVLGYEDEPYLQLSPSFGVRENRNSPAVYLNQDEQGDADVPPFARADAPPDWQSRGSLPSYAWHDHRTHWMSSTPPDTDARSTRVSEWTIPLRFDEDGTGAFTYGIEARGELWYDTPLAWWIPVAIAAVPVAAVTAFALLRRHRPDVGERGARTPTLAQPVAGFLAAVGLLTLVGVVDDLYLEGQTGGQRLVAAAIAVTVLGALAWAVWRGWRGDDTGFLALCGAGVALTWAYGWIHRDLLSASQLRGTLPDLLVRVTAGLQLLAVVPPLVVLLAWQFRHRPVPLALRPPRPPASGEAAEARP